MYVTLTMIMFHRPKHESSYSQHLKVHQRSRLINMLWYQLLSRHPSAEAGRHGFGPHVPLCAYISSAYEYINMNTSNHFANTHKMDLVYSLPSPTSWVIYRFRT